MHLRFRRFSSLGLASLVAQGWRQHQRQGALGAQDLDELITVGDGIEPAVVTEVAEGEQDVGHDVLVDPEQLLVSPIQLVPEFEQFMTS